MLAEAISQALGKKLIIWNIKSTTKAQDGLYVYDVVQRLYDSQFGGEGVDDIAKYVRLGKLGEAFTSEEQVILLIDEIDKADLEFPNDLLWELDRMEFHIPETGETVTARHRPVVIITSNAEKELPDAFLRRCVFHYIEFPDKELMAEIVRVHFPNLEENLLTQALEAFYRIRQMPQIKKKPSTSEIIDWLRALVHEGVDPKRVVKEVPYLGVLLKKNEIWTPCAGPGDKRIPRAAQVCRPYGEAGDFAYSVGAGVLTGPHVYGTFPVISGRMRTSAPTHHAFGPQVLIGPFVCGRFPAIGGRGKPPPLPIYRKAPVFFVGARCVRPRAGLGPAPTVFEEAPAYP